MDIFCQVFNKIVGTNKEINQTLFLYFVCDRHEENFQQQQQQQQVKSLEPKPARRPVFACTA